MLRQKTSFLLLLAAFFLGSSIYAESRKLQDGPDLTIVNTLLQEINVEIPTDDIETTRASQNIRDNIQVVIDATVGGDEKLPGACNNLRITDQGGVTMQGSRISNLAGRERYSVTVSAFGIGIDCVVPLRAEVVRANILGVPIPLNFLTARSGTGEMAFFATELSFSQTIILESTDFVTTGPDTVSPGDCQIDPGRLAIDARNVLTLFENFIGSSAEGISLDGQIEDALESDSSLLLNPLREQVCALLSDLTDTVGEFLISNPLTDASGNGLLDGDNFLDLSGNGIIDALDKENELENPDNIELLDFQKGNFLTDIFFPKGGSEEENILGNLFDTFNIGGTEVSQDDAVGLLAAVLNQNFDLNIPTPIIDFNLLRAIKSISDDVPFQSDAAGGPLVVVDDQFEFGGNDTDFFSIGISFAFNEMLLSQTNLDETGDSAILQQMEFIGKHTVLLPGVYLGDFDLSALADLKINISYDPADPDASFIPAFTVDFPLETLDLNVAVDNLLGKVAGLMVIEEDKLMGLQVGPLLEEALNCIANTLFTPTILTGLQALVTSIEGVMTGANDAIINFIVDMVNAMLFAYQSVLTRAVETLIADQILVNGEEYEIFVPDETKCLEVVPNNVTINEPYNFSGGIFPNIIDAVDAEFVEQALSFVVSTEEDGVPLVLIDNEDGTGFDFNLFEIDGWFQTVSLLVTEVSVDGLAPAQVNDASLGVAARSSVVPQDIGVTINAGSSERPITLNVGLNLDITGAQRAADFPEADISTAPEFMIPSQNQIDIHLSIGEIQAFLEVYASLSIYDVEGTTIEDALKIPCWVSELAPYGGWTDRISAVVEGLGASVDCNCESPLLLALQESMQNTNSWGELTEFVQLVVDLVIQLLPNNFNEERFNFTIESATRVCAGRPALTREYDLIEIDFNDPSVYGFIAGLVAALGFTLPFMTYKRARLLGSKSSKKGGKNLSVRSQNALLEEAPVGGPAGDVERLERERERVDEEEQRRRREEYEAALAAENEVEVAVDEEREKEYLDTLKTPMERIEAFEKDNKNKAESVPLFRNEHIPKPVRILIGTLLFSNIGFFIYGDFGVAIIMSLVGDIFGAKLEREGFATFSVLTSSIDLWQGGAVGLALLIILLAIVWPYFKMISLIICYFLKPGRCVGNRFRGRLLHFLDAFGRWSMIEIFFIIFLRIVFELTIASPREPFLPDQDLYSIGLIIAPQLSFYAFTTAVLISIALSNVLVIYHERILRNNEEDLMKVMIETVNQDLFIRHSISDFTFINKGDSQTSDFQWKVTSRGKLFVGVYLAFAVVVIFLSGAIDVIYVEYLGIARLALQIEGQATEINFSIFSILTLAWNDARESADAGKFFLVIAACWSLVISPLLVVMFLARMFFDKFTLSSARQFRDYLTVLKAWNGIEVFVLAVGVAILEVPLIASYLAGDQCDFVIDFMATTLEPLGLASREDTASTCFGLLVSLPSGAYVIIFYLFVFYFLTFLITSMFKSFITQRRMDLERKEPTMEKYDEEPMGYTADEIPKLKPMNVPWGIAIGKKLGILSVVRITGAQ